MNWIIKGWKTSLLGIGTILTSIGGTATGKMDKTQMVTAIIAGIGLLFAKDVNATGGSSSK